MFKDEIAQKEFDLQGYYKCKLLENEEIEAILDLYASTKDKSGLDLPFYTSIWSNNQEYKREVDSKLKEILSPKLEGLCLDFRTVFANFMVKASGQSSALHPHQDWSFVDEEDYQSITVWIPLKDVSSYNGALEVYPKSHNINNFKRARFLDSPFRNLSALISEKFMKSIEMKKGEALFVNSRTIHSSPNNSSDEERIAASIVIVPKKA